MTPDQNQKNGQHEEQKAENAINSSNESIVNKLPTKSKNSGLGALAKIMKTDDDDDEGEDEKKGGDEASNP